MIGGAAYAEEYTAHRCQDAEKMVWERDAYL